MAAQVKIISKKKLGTGEGPHWDEKTQSLYFTDIPNCIINKYDPKTGLHTQAKVCKDKVLLISWYHIISVAYLDQHIKAVVTEDADVVSVIIPVENESNKFLITLGCSVATVVWDGVNETVSDVEVLETLKEDSDMRTNDGKVSPSGVFFIGTMNRNPNFNNFEKRKGNLYSLKNLKAKRLLSEVMISNGLAWSHDESVLYFIDSPKFKVVSYQYDKETTKITNEKSVFDFKENNIEGFPDGMTIDTDGNLWVACYDGSQVINIDPRTGKLLKTIPLPARYITSVAFGGPNFEDLYVTSGLSDGPNFPHSKPEDGYTFVITGTGTRGLPAKAIKL